MPERGAEVSDALSTLTAIGDPDSFCRWENSAATTSGEAASDAVRRAQSRTGLDESVVTGKIRVLGREVAAVALEFAFIGGTVGVRASARMIEAIRRGTAAKLPLLLCTSSGGTRVTEGTRAFVTMISIAAALDAHKAAGLPVISYLRNPTFGGALASWGSMGQLTIAEPGANIGFLGPKVHAALKGSPMPAGVQRAENLRKRRIVDRIATPKHARDVIAAFLAVLDPGQVADQFRGNSSADTTATEGSPDVEIPSAWDVVVRSRADRRPNASHVLRLGWPTVFFFDDARDRESQVRLAIASTSHGPALVIAQNRGGTGMLQAADFQVARRGLEIAEQLRLPVITIIDTPGAESSESAENAGIGCEIARTISALLRYPNPVVSILLGQGSGGGAIALLPADTTIAAQNSWLAPLPPEAVRALIYHDAIEASEAAQGQGLDPGELRTARIVDAVVAEYPEVSNDPSTFSVDLATHVDAALSTLQLRDPGQLRIDRRNRYLGLSEPPEAGDACSPTASAGGDTHNLTPTKEART